LRKDDMLADEVITMVKPRTRKHACCKHSV